jgi:hypothetical protein
MLAVLSHFSSNALCFSFGNNIQSRHIGHVALVKLVEIWSELWPECSPQTDILFLQVAQHLPRGTCFLTATSPCS